MNPQGHPGFDLFVWGLSPALLEIREKVLAKLQRCDLSIVILGPTGVGKEHLAWEIHRESSRRKGPFVATQLSSVPDELLWSYLFGHEKGSFTDGKRERLGHFREASGGTLLLDEIAEISLAAQLALLRAAERKEVEPLGRDRPVPVDVRIIAATNADLPALVRQGAFREDLYHRLAQFVLRIPALRERQEDVPILLEHFLRASPGAVFLPDALEYLHQYDWPGNVRQLQTVAERSKLERADGPLTLERVRAILDETPQCFSPESPIGPPRPAPPLRAVLEEVSEKTKEAIAEALVKAEGNISAAAASLGISRFALYRLLRRHGLPKRHKPDAGPDLYPSAD